MKHADFTASLGHKADLNYFQPSCENVGFSHILFKGNKNVRFVIYLLVLGVFFDCASRFLNLTKEI